MKKTLIAMMSADHSIVHAIQKAKKAWQPRSGVTQPLWIASYICYVNGRADSIGCAIVEASSAREARQQFHRENFGETCRITAAEKAK